MGGTQAAKQKPAANSRRPDRCGPRLDTCLHPASDVFPLLSPSSFIDKSGRLTGVCAYPAPPKKRTGTEARAGAEIKERLPRMHEALGVIPAGL